MIFRNGHSAGAPPFFSHSPFSFQFPTFSAPGAGFLLPASGNIPYPKTGSGAVFENAQVKPWIENASSGTT